jgi:membrane associated rhomboid family serine protease
MDVTLHPLEAILRRCAEAAPEPWYPSLFAQASGVARDSLDPYLDQLRMAGLVRLTDWVQGRGQGYALTPHGQEVLQNPRYLARFVNDGRVPGLPEPAQREPGWQPVHERRQAIKEALTGPATPWVTRVIIALNILWFLFGLVLAGQQGIPSGSYLWGERGAMRVLHEIGAIIYEDIHTDRQWWRLLACCFVHFGLIHLGVNMYSLYAVGPLLERMWGSWRFLVLYLISGLGGSAAMILWGGRALGAGASGALWGIMATMVTWILLNRRYLPRQVTAASMRQLILVFVLNIAITLGLPILSKEAHFGGGLVGLIAAVPMHVSLYGRPWQRALALGLLVLALVGCGWIFVQSVS